MKLLRIVSLLSFSATIGSMSSGCFTLNVNMNFPETAVQQATDDFVHDLYRSRDKGKSESEESVPSPKGKNESKFEFNLFPSAYAAEPPKLTFKIGGARAQKIRDKLINNLPEVLNYKKAGVLGETNDGKLIIKNRDTLKPLLQQKVEKVVSDEQAARDELYLEVIRSNQLDKDRLIDVKKSFAHSSQLESPKGTWIEDEKGNWTQK